MKINNAKGKSLYDAVENKLKEVINLSKYLNIFEESIIKAYPILFHSSENDYLYKKARDYFFFAVIPSIEIIKNNKLSEKHKKDLIKVQTLLSLSERFSNNIIDRHSKGIENDLIFYTYTIHEVVNLLESDLKDILEILPVNFFNELKKVAKAAYFKIPAKVELYKDKTNFDFRILAKNLWKRASSIFIIPTLIGTSQERLRAFKYYISANILLDDLIDIFDDYKHNRETLPLLFWKFYSKDILFNKWAFDFITKEIMNIIKNYLNRSSKLFKKEGLQYPSQIANILRDKYYEWFPEHI
jgi:hypothetical protein